MCGQRSFARHNIHTGLLFHRYDILFISGAIQPTFSGCIAIKFIFIVVENLLVEYYSMNTSSVYLCDMRPHFRTAFEHRAYISLLYDGVICATLIVFG